MFSFVEIILAMGLASPAPPPATKAKPCLMAGAFDGGGLLPKGSTERIAVVARTSTLTFAGAKATLTVTEPLAFTAQMPAAKMLLRPRATLKAASGVLGLGKASRVRPVRTKTSGMLAVDIVTGWPGASIGQTTLPCSSLIRQDRRGVKTENAQSQLPDRKTEQPADLGMVLRSQRKSSAAGFKLATSELIFERLAKVGRWYQLETRWADGTRLKGWVLHDQLDRTGRSWRVEGATAVCGIAKVFQASEWIPLRKGSKLISPSGENTWAVVSKPVTALVLPADANGWRDVLAIRAQGFEVMRSTQDGRCREQSSFARIR